MAQTKKFDRDLYNVSSNDDTVRVIVSMSLDDTCGELWHVYNHDERLAVRRTSDEAIEFAEHYVDEEASLDQVSTMALLEAFDNAAQRYGWSSDQSGDKEAADDKAAYDKAKTALVNRITKLTQKTTS